MVKATIRKPVPATKLVATPDLGKPGYIDVEATPVATADDTSAEALADALDAGAPVPGSEEAVEAEVNGGRAVAVRPALPVSPYVTESGGGFEGEWDQDDFRLPQLKIVNGSGELAQKYNTGTLLYADEMLCKTPDISPGAANPTIPFVVLKATKQYRENLTPDEVKEGLMPRVVSSRREAEELGGSTRWENNEKPRWSPSARCILLVQEFEGCDHPGFAYQLDGKNWALAVYYAGGMAYGESAKQIFNAAPISLREGNKIVLHCRVWNLQVVKKKAGKFVVWVPAIKLTKTVTGPQVRDLADRVVSGRTSDAGD